VASCEKHTSLLYCSINYHRKSFIVKVSGVNVYNFFSSWSSGKLS